MCTSWIARTQRFLAAKVSAPTWLITHLDLSSLDPRHIISKSSRRISSDRWSNVFVLVLFTFTMSRDTLPALRRISCASIKSGHGYHLVSMFEQPIVNLKYTREELPWNGKIRTYLTTPAKLRIRYSNTGIALQDNWFLS